jgi:hypothetical protein
MTPEEVQKRKIMQALLASMGRGGQQPAPMPQQASPQFPRQAPPSSIRVPRQAPAMPVQGGAGQAQIRGQQGGDIPAMTPMQLKEYRDKVWDPQVADSYDKDAAKLAIEWAVEGKNADVAKSLEQLREAHALLDSGADNLSGPMVGSWLGQAVAPVLNPESITTKEAIEEVVQRNLRLVLGPQFTQQEGERLISRAFNPQLQEPENAKRVGRLLRSIEDAAAAREAATQYFMKYGTLVGWDGRIPNKADIEAAIDAEDSPAAGSAPDDDGWVTLPNGMKVREKR